MTTRFTHGKARTETPRLKDIPDDLTVREPSEGRDECGRFAPGNGAATERGAKQIAREALEGLPPEIARDVLVTYRAICRTLPSDGPDVRPLVAARCRHAALATLYTAEAVKAGLATKEGLKLAEQARSHDLAAQRLAITALDIAQKEAASDAAEIQRQRNLNPLGWDDPKPARPAPEDLT